MIQRLPDYMGFAFQDFGYSWIPTVTEEEKHLLSKYKTIMKYIDLAFVFITYFSSSGATVSLCSWKSWNTLEGNAK